MVESCLTKSKKEGIEMGRCKYINDYGMACGVKTLGNKQYCSVHEKVQKLKDEGLWEETVKKANDKDYDPYKEASHDDSN